jgi:integrase
MSDICDELEAELTLREKGGDVSHEYLKNAKYENGVLKKWFGSMTLQQMTSELVKTKFLESSYGPVTKRNILRGLKAREAFARRKRYIPKTFDSPFEDVRLPTPRPSEKPVFTPEEMTRLFIVLKPSQLLYVATVAFGGGRCSESRQLKGSDFLDEEQVIRVGVDIAKNPSRRILEQTDNLLAWKAVAPEVGPDAMILSKHQAKKVYSDKARLREVGLVWRKNGLRTSFISYHLAKYRKIELTRELAGNSPDIIHSNYKALVTPSAAEAWFNITPISVRAYAEEKGLSHLIKW